MAGAAPLAFASAAPGRYVRRPPSVDTMRFWTLLAVVALAGCGGSRVTFDPAASRSSASAAEVAAGEALYPFESLSRWGYMDATGRVVVAPAFDAANGFEGGRAAVRVGERWGYVDPAGRLAVPAEFDSAAPFSEGRGLVGVQTPAGPRYGFVDAAGVLVVPPVLPNAYSYRDGRALARLRERDATALERLFGAGPALGFLDLDGRVVIDVEGEAESFSGGLAALSERTGGLFGATRWGFIRPDGSVAVEPDLERAYLFSDGLARVARGGRIGYVDRAGEPAFPETFELGLGFSEGRAAVREGGRWGYVDRTGALVVPARFEAAGAFSGGLAAVREGGRWGYVGPDGAFVIAPVFAEAQAFRGPLALVADETGSYYVTREGEPVRPQMTR